MCVLQLKMLRKKWFAAVPQTIRARADADDVFLSDSLHRLTGEKERRGTIWRPASVVRALSSSGLGTERSSDSGSNVNNTHGEQQQLHQEYLRLYKRHLAALESVAQARAEKEQLKKQKLALTRARLAVSRDQWEVSLFSAQPDTGDSVSSDFLALKRKQVRDQLKNEVYSQKRSAALPIPTVATDLPAPAAQFHAVSEWMMHGESATSSAPAQTSSRRQESRRSCGVAL